ncbi:MAG: hypothetical protein ABJM06_04730 [Gilvibacter sp.]
MADKAQLLWDFRGPSALRTAEHHLVHLKEYAIAEQISEARFELIEHSQVFVSAAMVVSLEKVTELRNRLQPHRGKRITDK